MIMYKFFLIEGAQKIAVKQEKQDKGQGDPSNAGKLRGKAQPALPLFAQSDGKAKPQRAKECGRSDNDADDRTDHGGTAHA